MLSTNTHSSCKTWQIPPTNICWNSWGGGGGNVVYTPAVKRRNLNQYLGPVQTVRCFVTPEFTEPHVIGWVWKPQDTTGHRRTNAVRPQETCKSPKDATGATGHLENLNCTEINQPLDVYTCRTRMHPVMQHFSLLRPVSRYRPY